MPFDRILVRCERAEPNNGTVSLTMIKRAELTDSKSREEIIQASLARARGPYEVGKDYWIEIYPA
jgi:hypothetical protein